MALWLKDTTRAPMVVYNPADSGVVGVVYNVIGGQPVTAEGLELLLEAAGGIAPA